MEPGETVAVYDLGGGTFDATVLRRADGGFEIIGEPEGIERLGGIDFDEAVFAHVRAGVGDAFAQLDPADPVALTAVARLREDCIAAKEALSSDTDAAIPVLLPTVQTEIRLRRAEFEDMIRPALTETIGSLRRALRSAASIRPTSPRCCSSAAARASHSWRSSSRASSAGRWPSTRTRSTRSRSVPLWPVRPRPDTRKERPRSSPGPK